MFSSLSFRLLYSFLSSLQRSAYPKEISLSHERNDVSAWSFPIPMKKLANDPAVWCGRSSWLPQEPKLISKQKTGPLGPASFLVIWLGLSLCEAFSLPPRAIIKTEANRLLLAQMPFFFDPASLTKASFRRSAVSQKNRTTFDCAICFSFVIRLGFEPKTHSLEGCCSIQLSYGTNPWLSLQI